MVARGPGRDGTDLPAVDPFSPASDVELSSCALRVGYMAVERVHAATRDVAPLGRGRLHEDEEAALSDDRGDGVHPWNARVAHGRQVGGHDAEAQRTELRELGSLGGELAPRDAVADAADRVRGGLAHRLDASLSRADRLVRQFWVIDISPPFRSNGPRGDPVLSSPPSSRAHRSLPLRQGSTPSARRRSATWRPRRGSPSRRSRTSRTST